MNAKTAAVAMLAVTVGVIVYAARTVNNVPPSDLRDAVGEGTAMQQLENSANVGSPGMGVNPTVASGDIVLKSEAPQLSSYEMQMLVNLAQRVYAIGVKDIQIGERLYHSFGISGESSSDGSFRLKRITLYRSKTSLLDILFLNAETTPEEQVTFFVYSDGSVLSGSFGTPYKEQRWTDNDRRLFSEEVAFWVKYEKKRSRY